MINDLQLTENFWLSEFTKSQTASRLGIDNFPSDQEIINLKLLCKNVLQPLREMINRPIYIMSGYRCRVLNSLINGARDSQHMKGEASDIDFFEDNKSIFHLIREELIFDQLIWEFGDNNNPAWIHVSYSKNMNRGQILKALLVKERVNYEYMHV